MLRDSASRAPRLLYLLGYICDQPFFLIVVWTQRCSPTHLQCSSVGFSCKAVKLISSYPHLALLTNFPFGPRMLHHSFSNWSMWFRSVRFVTEIRVEDISGTNSMFEIVVGSFSPFISTTIHNVPYTLSSIASPPPPHTTI